MPGLRAGGTPLCGDELLLRFPSQHARQLGIGRSGEHSFVAPTDEATRIRATTAGDSGPSALRGRSTVRERIASDRVAWPERRLMAAVLQAVVDDLRGSVHRHAAGYGASTDSRRRRAAVAYVARRDREWPFSFDNLCDALSLDPGRLRNAFETAPRPGRHVTDVACRERSGLWPRSIVPLDVKAGDRIPVRQLGAEITVDEEEDLSLREEDVLGIVEV
jgi:hypothetical protein